MFGYQREICNIFTWDMFKLNLPGRLDYDPSMPWVDMMMLDDGKIASDFMLFIVDARPSASTE
jgi:hypothetical protein